MFGSSLHGLPRLQNLFDGPQQTVGVTEHESVEFAAARIVHRAALQGLQVKTNRRNGSLQLVGDRVDKTVMLLVAADFAHQENRVQDDAGSNRTEEDESKENLNAFLPVEDDPTAADSQRRGRQPDAQCQEESNRFAARGDAHGWVPERLYPAGITAAVRRCSMTIFPANGIVIVR